MNEINNGIVFSEYIVLVVDDVISNTNLLKAVLSKEGYTIITANDGLKALEMIEKQLPDLILLDIIMPVLSGFDVAERLKSDDRYKNIPIIFLSALNQPEDIVKGFRIGGNDFISKPFNQGELKTRIKHQITLIAALRTILMRTEELRKTINERDKLYSVIAHDLRGPIGSLKMVLNMLMMNLDEDKIGVDMFDFLNVANKTTEDIFVLLDNLLKWTKSQMGRLNVAYQDFDLIPVLQGSVEIFSILSKLKDITITIMESRQSIEVHADSDMVQTIMRNLLSNAIKFSNNKGVIEVFVDINDNFVIVTIKDYGEGIEDVDKEKLLNPQTHFSTFGTNNEEGSGLGLLLCKDFAIKNGGDLWFKSVYGEGSEFSFSIPQSNL